MGIFAIGFLLWLCVSWRLKKSPRNLFLGFLGFIAYIIMLLGVISYVLQD